MFPTQTVCLFVKDNKILIYSVLFIGVTNIVPVFQVCLMKKADKILELANVAARLKQLRKSKGFNNYEHIAFELGMSRSAYWRLESGENFSLKTLLKICKLLGVTFEEFFSGVNVPKVEKKRKSNLLTNKTSP